VPELRTHAISLPFFGYLLEGPIPSILIGRDRIVPVATPHAGRFCMHKLAVYSLRTGAEHPKGDKDALQAAILTAALAQEQDFLLREEMRSVPEAMRAQVARGAKRAIALLEGAHPQAADLLAPLAQPKPRRGRKR